MTVPTLQASPPDQAPGTAPFHLHLANFDGPFDLLLHLISRRKLDITEIALAEVTDEFLSYIEEIYASDTREALETASEFLVTAATLLELKASRLLPRSAAHLQANAELLEARDLLFARLLQYRAYREVAGLLEERFRVESQRFARSVALEEGFSRVLPELVFDLGPQEFARIAARALSANRQDADEAARVAEVGVDHLHTPVTTIAEQQEAILARLSQDPRLTFAELIEGVGDKEVTVVRFLALLELYKEDAIDLEQEKALGTIVLTARSAGSHRLAPEKGRG